MKPPKRILKGERARPDVSRSPDKPPRAGYIGGKVAGGTVAAAALALQMAMFRKASPHTEPRDRPYGE